VSLSGPPRCSCAGAANVLNRCRQRRLPDAPFRVLHNHAFDCSSPTNHSLSTILSEAGRFPCFGPSQGCLLPTSERISAMHAFSCPFAISS